MKVETAAEIVAKKMWRRGDRATARDLFDLSLVIEHDRCWRLVISWFAIETLLLSNWLCATCSSVNGSQIFRPWTTHAPSITPLLSQLKFCERSRERTCAQAALTTFVQRPHTRKGLSLR